MRRAAPWLLLVAGILLLLSAFAHALLGLSAVRGELTASGVAADLADGISVGWLYGSAAMLTFGVIILIAWWGVRKGNPAAGWVAAPIGLLYLGFGTWAFVYSSLNPHFMGFIVIGALMGIGAYGLRTRS